MEPHLNDEDTKKLAKQIVSGLIDEAKSKLSSNMLINDKNNNPTSSTEKSTNIEDNNDENIVPKMSNKSPSILISTNDNENDTNVISVSDKQDIVDDSSNTNNHDHDDDNETTTATTSNCITKSSEKPLFLTIDHKLAIRRRNTGQVKQFEECDTPSPTTMTMRVSPLLKQATTTSTSLNGLTTIKQINEDDQQQNGRQPNQAKQQTPLIDNGGHLDKEGLQKQLKSDMSGLLRRILISTFMTIFISVVEVYTWITLPIYYWLQKPWIKRKVDEESRIRVYHPPKSTSTKINPIEEEQMTPIYERNDSKIFNHTVFQYENMTDMYEMTSFEYGSSRVCLGYRQVLSEEVSLDDQGNPRRIDGRQLKQYRLSEYKWLSYQQVADIANNLAQGFMTKGFERGGKVLIISETRIEWMLCFRAILKTGTTLVTVFSNLGVDGVAHAIDESQVETVITSLECMPLLKEALNHSKHHIKQIIYMDGIHKPNVDFGTDIQLISLSNIELIGKQLTANGQSKPYVKPSLSDMVVIMYTSGTTGAPKGACMSHRQFAQVMKALFVLVRDIMDEAPFHTYISYLPMAHVLELTLELFFNLGGVRLGYASPFTLTDSAPGLCPGQIPDIKLLKPTVMTAVPLVLDRIIKEMNEKLRSRTPVSLPVVSYLIDYKSKWTKLGYRCDLVTKLVCPKVREQLGGNLIYMICGGAPLNANTQATIKSALDVTLVQGYGATETTGATFCVDFGCLGYGHVGGPLGEIYFRLRDWAEGGYSVKDKPNPRGEILIGGEIVSMGYFNRPQLNEESFYTDQHGMRWFCSGDICELFPNGTIKIIDRCKDLIKLQNGEYISLGKVEAALKICNYVDNICVYGGTFSNDIVALISPNRKALNELANSLGKSEMTIEQKCNDHQIQQTVLNDIIKTAKHVSLGKKEIPRRIKLVPEEWSPDNGILTAAMKLKRRSVEQIYKQDLYDLYNAQKFNVVTTNGYDQNNNATDNNNISTSNPIKS